MGGYEKDQKTHVNCLKLFFRIRKWALAEDRHSSSINSRIGSFSPGRHIHYYFRDGFMI